VEARERSVSTFLRGGRMNALLSKKLFQIQLLETDIGGLVGWILHS
jgi:hypothetical protein